MKFFLQEPFNFLTNWQSPVGNSFSPVMSLTIRHSNQQVTGEFSKIFSADWRRKLVACMQIYSCRTRQLPVGLAGILQVSSKRSLNAGAGKIVVLEVKKIGISCFNYIFSKPTGHAGKYPIYLLYTVSFFLFATLRWKPIIIMLCNNVGSAICSRPLFGEYKSGQVVNSRIHKCFQASIVFRTTHFPWLKCKMWQHCTALIAWFRKVSDECQTNTESFGRRLSPAPYRAWLFISHHRSSLIKTNGNE